MNIQIFTPGRTELAGNHTDHQNGRILASAVDLGLYADVTPLPGNIVKVNSEGYESFTADIGRLGVLPVDFGSSKALVRGVAAAFKELGLNVGAFEANIRSTLPAGGGLSSSAAFAVMIGKIFNELYNDGTIDPIVIARAAQQAENEYFGKPCGMMDQLTCSLGHTVYVDFKTREIVPIKADFSQMGLILCLTDTGGSHAGLDSSYARIPADMVYVANLFDKGKLADVDPEQFYERAKNWNITDRPVRRAMHFFNENARVPKMRDALIAGDGETYIRLMNESGRSSEKLLTNIYTSATGDMKLTEGLELSASILEGKGAWRVHGGGFAGFVQALMPAIYFEEYKTKMEEKFGAGTCRIIHLV